MKILKHFLCIPLRIFYDQFLKLYKRRIAYYIASLCEDGSTVLDVGCDDGSLAKMIIDFKPSLKFEGVDIQDRRPSFITRKIYDGKRLPYPEHKFDIVMAVDVLHHTHDIPSLLAEMKRVSTKYLLIKDHCSYGKISEIVYSVFDYFANVAYGIPCAFNYPSPTRWKRYFQELQLELVAQPAPLDFSFFLTDKTNPIFKLMK